MSINNFINYISAEMVSAVNNNFEDNYDYNRFGKLVLSKKKFTLKQKIVIKLNKHGFYNNFSNNLFSNRIKNSKTKAFNTDENY